MSSVAVEGRRYSPARPAAAVAPARRCSPQQAIVAVRARSLAMRRFTRTHDAIPGRSVQHRIIPHLFVLPMLQCGEVLQFPRWRGSFHTNSCNCTAAAVRRLPRDAETVALTVRCVVAFTVQSRQPRCASASRTERTACSGRLLVSLRCASRTFRNPRCAHAAANWPASVFERCPCREAMRRFNEAG